MKDLFKPNDEVLIRSPSNGQMVVGMVVGCRYAYERDLRTVTYTVRYKWAQFDYHLSSLGHVVSEYTSDYTQGEFKEEDVFLLPRQMGLFGEIGDYNASYDVFGNSHYVDAMRYATREMLISGEARISIGGEVVGTFKEGSIGIDWGLSEKENK